MWKGRRVNGDRGHEDDCWSSGDGAPRDGCGRSVNENGDRSRWTQATASWQLASSATAILLIVLLLPGKNLLSDHTSVL